MSKANRESVRVRVSMQFIPESGEATEHHTRDHTHGEAHGEADFHPIEAGRFIHLTTARISGRNSWHCEIETWR